MAVGASFLALYSGTGARLRSQIDAQLRTQAGEWRQFTAGADLSTPAALERAARRFIAGQRYHAEALVTAVQVNGGRTVSSDPELVGREEDREQSPGAPEGLFGAPPGLSTATVAEAGPMRVLVAPIVARRASGRNAAARQSAHAGGAGTVEPAAHVRDRRARRPWCSPRWRALGSPR